MLWGNQYDRHSGLVKSFTMKEPRGALDSRMQAGGIAREVNRETVSAWLNTTVQLLKQEGNSLVKRETDV